LRSFQQDLPLFNARGIRVVGISADTVEETQRHGQKSRFTFPLLCDPKTEVIRRYNLLHAGGGMNGSDISRPAEFLIDATGTIRWVNRTESVLVRARPGQVLKAFDALKLAATSAR
jgi:peroxiredoxin